MEQQANVTKRVPHPLEGLRHATVSLSQDKEATPARIIGMYTHVDKILHRYLLLYVNRIDQYEGLQKMRCVSKYGDQQYQHADAVIPVST